MNTEQNLDLQWLDGVPQASIQFAEIINWLIYISIAIMNVVLIGGVIYFGYQHRKKSRSVSKRPLPIKTTEYLSSEMEEFAKKGEYRLAIKSCFHLLLKILAKKKNLFFSVTKTNGEYRQDLREKDPHGAVAFHDLSIYFDEVWYGEKKVGKEEYLQYRRDVFGFLGEVESDEKR